LRHHAETDPAALGWLRQMADSSDAPAQFAMETQYDPDFQLGKLTAAT
jgi:hypothetical protein